MKRNATSILLPGSLGEFWEKSKRTYENAIEEEEAFCRACRVRKALLERSDCFSVIEIKHAIISC